MVNVYQFTKTSTNWLQTDNVSKLRFEDLKTGSILICLLWIVSENEIGIESFRQGHIFS